MMLRYIKKLIELVLRPFIDILLQVRPASNILPFPRPNYPFCYFLGYLTWPIYLIYVHFFDQKTEASRQFIIKRVQVFIIDPVAKTVAPIAYGQLVIMLILFILIFVFLVLFWRYDCVLHDRSLGEMVKKFKSWPEYHILGIILICMVLATGFIGFLLARIHYFLYPMYVFYILFFPLGFTILFGCGLVASFFYDVVWREYLLDKRKERGVRR